MLNQDGFKSSDGYQKYSFEAQTTIACLEKVCGLKLDHFKRGNK